ncbi:biotin/lipoyl-containing protein [Sphingorhabdus sp. 109]|jgi:pyruvate/2-oxoglutarate dehydrogenase complex dihydrolipoamide acyltransferase (E2) component|uniref:biotin/lipoyl-containing protein n=1 Tax=Sphingorhabdus sp. 109 TaxID=2653173 RepID=UPI0012EEEA93|nr:lipoyl domain-containing protein [Sphingorhabdus sp. 109]VWX57253.1 Biotin attachment protein [Sphingorhabdus sp. 109]
MTDILVPHGQWEADQDAALATWLYGDGETVQEGVTVAEIMVEKTSFEIPAPASGTLSIAVEEDAIVAPGQVLGSIR